ncbi:MAG: DegT/DnrJ/EryC1/StrS family aminotransferase [Planctomycetota bacterium]|nr:DegT/DnrJ/EryC1/StrS family aminotransferase [Planctomycetota bacterium]
MATRSPQSVPAILGGPMAVTLDGREANRWPILTHEDEEAVLQVLRDGDLSLHPVTRALEDDYRACFGMRHALAHCNGTAALLAAFVALDLRPGDEVLVPSATFWASVVPMLWVGAVPVFCESEPQRMGLDPDDVERKITPRTRAMVVVHLWGMPCRMTELLDIAGRHDLKIIEDASHAHGAVWRGRQCGTLGDISVISLQGDKLAPAGEGGILLTNDDAFMERAVCLGDIVRIHELESAARRFAGTSFGIKTRMAPMSAAVARVQLRRLPERNARRNENLRYLSNGLEALGVETFQAPPHIERVYFEYLIRYDADRWSLPIDKLIEALRAEGCDASWPRYPLVHQQPLFTEGHFARILRGAGGADAALPIYRPDALPGTEAAAGAMLKLPTFPSAERDLLDQYVAAFEKVLSNAELIAAR